MTSIGKDGSSAVAHRRELRPDIELPAPSRCECFTQLVNPLLKGLFIQFGGWWSFVIFQCLENLGGSL